MSKPTATERLRRIVNVLPWVAANPGVTDREIAARFGMDVAEVVADLDVAFMVGVPPYTPDAMIDVVREGEQVFVHLGAAFTRPLRLTESELLALYLAVRAMLAAGDAAGNDVLERAAAKLGSAIGALAEGRITVDLGDADETILTACRRASEDGTLIEIDYYGFLADRETTRCVEPRAVFSRDGHWYLWSWCRSAGGERMFRVDRIRAMRPMDESVSPWEGDEPPEPRPDADTVATVVVAVDRATAAGLEEYRPVSLDPLADGRVAVTLPVAGDAWLARLILRLGPGAEIVEDGDQRSMTRPEVLAAVAPFAAAIARRHQP